MPTNLATIETYSAADGRRLALRVWQPVAPPKARIVFLHGVISHSGWYGECAAHLAENGIEVHYLDRRGSGLNSDDPGDIDQWQTWINDVATYLNILHLRRDGLRTVLCGISWGGKLAAAVARQHAGSIDGLALICPGLYSPFSPRLARRLVLSLPVPHRIQERRLHVPLRKSELFTDSDVWKAFIERDPLTLRRVTWRFAQNDCYLSRYARQSAAYLYTPLLMMLAGRDRIVTNHRIRQFFAQTQSAKRTLIEYPHASHTLEFEIDPTVYFDDLVHWISRVANTARIDQSQSMSPQLLPALSGH